MRTGKSFKSFFVALLVTLLLTPLLVACPATPARGGATVIQTSPANLSFLGTSTTTVNVTANGAWSAESDQGWLQISPASGAGSGTVTVTIDRSGLAAADYVGSILFRGATATQEVVTVYMRFPSVGGSISGPPDQVRPGAVARLEPTSAQTASGFEYVPGEVLITLDPVAVALSQGQGEIGPLGELKVAPAEASALLQAASAVATQNSLRVQAPISTDLGLFVLETDSKSVAEAIGLLKRDGRVRSAFPNYIVRTLRTPNDPSYAEQWHYPQIGLPAAWELTIGAEDRVVAIVDGGLDVTHPDLAARVVPGYDFVLNTTAMIDADGHGTHVAGTVGAATDNNVGVAGVDWNARLMPVRVLDETGGTIENVIRGILFAAGFCVDNSVGGVVCPDQQAQVINLSLGLPNRTDPGLTCVPMPETGMRHPIALALAGGSIIVAAAGNDACDVVSAPANYPGVVAVAATTRTDSVAPYSNFGPEIWIAAPGGDQSGGILTNGILSTLPGNSYGWFEGTSMASPHVAGVVSLMLAANRGLTPWLVKSLLADTATDLGPLGWDPDFGFGLVHAGRAVEAARALLTAHHSDFTVRIRGADLVAETRADPAGNFLFENIPAGSYTIEAGTDVNRNGVLGEPGEFFGSRELTLSYTGDVIDVVLNVQPR